MFKRSLKVGAAAAGLALAFGAAGTAQAQDDDQPARGPVFTDNENALTLNSAGGGSQIASVISIELEGQSLLSYCIQIENALQTDKIHEESDWDELGQDVENLDQVLAVLYSGFGPNDADTVFADAGVEAADEWSDDVKAKIAYAGTQGAIWSLTDGFELDADSTTSSDEQVDAAVTAVHDYLGGVDETVPEPVTDPQFDIDESAAEYADGQAGPYTVGTNIGPLGFEAPENVEIVDGDGNEVTELTDGLTFYAKTDVDENSEFALDITDFVKQFPVGRTFEATDEQSGDVSTSKAASVEGQRIILAETLEQTVEVELSFGVEIPEDTTPKLPVTGTSYAAIGGIGAVLLAAGVVTLVLMRRKNNTAGDWGASA
ncbi:thioester domain-containing protein [Salininema proteolyticum]|uniref:Thioester domain-containing protein n=1 Tax=Salininema proteolyticum TaxID=1607685 RepID=A0ABV8U3I4_9ACTN